MKSRFLADPDMTLSELIGSWPQTIPVFLRHRMLCVGCLVNPFHTLADACQEYGLDENLILDELAWEVSRAAGNCQSRPDGEDRTR